MRSLGTHRGPRDAVPIFLLLVASACAGLRSSRQANELVLDPAADTRITHSTELRLTLRNRGERTLSVPRPTPAFILVHTQSDRGRVLPCETAPVPEIVELVRLEPGADLPIEVDLDARCALDTEGELLARIRYSVPQGVLRVPGGEGAWIGSTRPVELQVVRSADAIAPTMTTK